MLVKFSDDDVPIVLRGYSNALLNHKNVEIQLVKDLSILIGRFDDPVDWDDYCQNYATIAGGLSMARLGLDTLHKTTEKYIVRYVSYSHVAGESAQLIMEFVKGLTLDKYLFLDSIGGQLSKAEARTVLHQLLEATEYFHRMNVTHRDIKPSNIILVSRDPILIKVVDFGLATEMTSFQTVCGTQPYFAPELLSMQSQPLTNKVDMFAIGVVATMLLFRISADELKKIKRPQDYVHFVLRQRQKAIADGSFKLTPLTPFGLILDLLSERPEDRPSAERCLSYAFFQREDDQETVHGSQSADIVTEQNAKDDDKNEDSFEALGADRRKRRMLEAPGWFKRRQLRDRQPNTKNQAS
ncbi:Protein kinase protein rad53 [Sporothrix epigloea]|uniref:Protein kinase protein rad53 n=1 Tax=Sporothrix epigloea TaxID=1892477 RepID=A0ABP0DTZ1_9PEZI